MKKIILIPLTIVLGVFLGFISHQSPSKTPPKVATEKAMDIFQVKELRTPKYLSEQVVDHKAEYQERRPKPTTKEEEIVAYYEDTIANQYKKNSEVYEQNSTVYVNLDGNPRAIASHGEKFEAVMMMPKLSASKEYIAYQWCDEKSNRCNVIVEHLATKTKNILEDAVSYSWHPKDELLVYDGVQKDDGHMLLESELFFYSPRRNIIVQLTDTIDFVEINPIFSEDGNHIYAEDEKTGRLLEAPLFVGYRDPYIQAVKLYKTSKSLSVEEIKKHAGDFKKIEEDEKFADPKLNYWVEIALNPDMKSGIYSTMTMPYIFDEISFTPEQLTIKEREKLMIPPEKERTYSLTFNYEAGKDPSHYYLRLKSYRLSPPLSQDFFKVEEFNAAIQKAGHPQKYYSYYRKQLIETILSSMVIGMILMSALYTAVMYFRRKKEGKRQKSLIYYTLMQIAMATFLLTAPVFFRGLFSFDFISMAQLTLIVAFFSTLFTQAFLETKKHLPIIHTILNAYLVLIVADMIWIFEPILMNYKLYEVFGLLFLVTAVLRVKDGFTPAWFYLIGWIGLLLAIFLMDYYHMRNFMMFVGVFIEAVMLAWGLVFVVEDDTPPPHK